MLRSSGWLPDLLSPTARPDLQPSPPPPRPRPPPPRPPPPPSPPPPRAPVQVPSNGVTSPLFGVWGERWNPADRLADWSPAGYTGGILAIPSYPAGFNVKDYGAQGVAGVGESLPWAGCSRYCRRLCAVSC